MFIQILLIFMCESMYFHVCINICICTYTWIHTYA